MSRPLQRRAAPLAAVDTVTLLSDTEVAGTKDIRGDEPYLEGHYPGFAIYPGVFILESACQLIEEYVRAAVPGASGAALTGVRSMRFLAALRPGHSLQLHCTIAWGPDDGLTAKVIGRNAAELKVTQLTLEFRVRRGDMMGVA